MSSIPLTARHKLEETSLLKDIDTVKKMDRIPESIVSTRDVNVSPGGTFQSTFLNTISFGMDSFYESTDRKSRAVFKHKETQGSWEKIQKCVLKKRFKDDTLFGKKKQTAPYGKSTAFGDIGTAIMNKPVSLINQQSVFGYHEDGTRKVNPFGTTNVY